LQLQQSGPFLPLFAAAAQFFEAKFSLSLNKRVAHHSFCQKEEELANLYIFNLLLINNKLI